MRKTLIIVLIFGRAMAQSPMDDLLNKMATEKADTSRLKILGQVFRQTVFQKPTEGLVYAKQYLALAQKTKNASETARGYNFIGMSYATIGDFDKAVPCYTQALHRYETLHDTLYSAISLNNIGAAYQSRKNHQETILYYEQALKTFRKIKNGQWIANVSNNLAAVYQETHQYSKALKTIEIALDIFKKNNDKASEATALNTKGTSFIFLKKYNEALKYFLKSNELVNPIEDPLQYSITTKNIGDVYLQLGQFQKAEGYLLKAAEVQKKIQSPEHLLSTLNALNLLYETWKKYPLAYRYLKESKTLSDSLFSKEKDARLLEVVKKYELGEKEQKIKLLSNQNKIKDLTISNVQQRQRLFGGGILLLSTVVVVGFYLYRLRQKSNQELAQKNEIISKTLSEKDFLMREIHHRVKNNLQVISSLLSLQSQHLKDPEALQSIKESRDRVKSMALIHQNLYEENHHLFIEVNDYIPKLAQGLFQSYNIEPERIHLRVEVQKMVLDLDTVTSLGLIINEIITNSLKYAFPENRSGTINLNLRKDTEFLILEINDNGVGIPQGFDFKTLKSFGYQIIRSFAAKMKAVINIENRNGTLFMMKIPLKKIIEKLEPLRK